MKKNIKNKKKIINNTKHNKKNNTNQSVKAFNIEKIKTNSINKKKLSTADINLLIKTQNNKIVVIAFVFLLFFVIIAIKMGYLQLVIGKELEEKASNQQMTESTIAANRGNILDRNGEILAQSLSVDTISINPDILRDNNENLDKEDFAKVMAEFLDLKIEDVLKKINSESSYELIKEKEEKDKVNKLKEYIKEKEINGVNIDPDFKRYYPYKQLAANVIGFCGTDNNGLEGLELELNDILVGKKGKNRAITGLYDSTVNNQNIGAEDGSDVYLTIDIKIQSILEKYLSDAHEDNSNDASIAIAMNPQTSEILAIATEPTYDLNNPFMPLDMTKAEWNKLSYSSKQSIQQKMWKNTAITDGYEPGSVFKIVTAAIGLEENKTVPDKEGDFTCTGRHKVVDTNIACWSWYNPHGELSLRGAIKNSCNPAFMQLVERIGKDTYYKYMEAFGLFEKTGVRLVGEEEGIKHDIENVGPVELAVMSFGQRFTITPLQMINAASTIANGGTLYTPQIIKQTTNSKTGSSEIEEAKAVRKVISEETSKEMMDMMYTGCGIHAKIDGYKIAGKSGTSEPQPGRESEGYVASFCAIAPSDDPQIALLVVQKNPKGYGYVDGGLISGSVVRKMLLDIFPIIGITKEGEKVEDLKKNLSQIPNVSNKTVSEARKILQEKGFNVVVQSLVNPVETVVTNQVPEAGLKIEKGSKIYLHIKEDENKVTVKVPDLLNKNVTNSINTLNKANLNYIIEGTIGTVVSQNPKKDTVVEEGTVVRFTIK